MNNLIKLTLATPINVFRTKWISAAKRKIDIDEGLLIVLIIMGHNNKSKLSKITEMENALAEKFNINNNFIEYFEKIFYKLKDEGSLTYDGKENFKNIMLGNIVIHKEIENAVEKNDFFSFKEEKFNHSKSFYRSMIGSNKKLIELEDNKEQIKEVSDVALKKLLEISKNNNNLNQIEIGVESWHIQKYPNEIFVSMEFDNYDEILKNNNVWNINAEYNLKIVDDIIIPEDDNCDQMIKFFLEKKAFFDFENKLIEQISPRFFLQEINNYDEEINVLSNIKEKIEETQLYFERNDFIVDNNLFIQIGFTFKELKISWENISKIINFKKLVFRNMEYHEVKKIIMNALYSKNDISRYLENIDNKNDISNIIIKDKLLINKYFSFLKNNKMMDELLNEDIEYIFENLLEENWLYLCEYDNKNNRRLISGLKNVILLDEQCLKIFKIYGLEYKNDIKKYFLNWNQETQLIENIKFVNSIDLNKRDKSELKSYYMELESRIKKHPDIKNNYEILNMKQNIINKIEEIDSQDFKKRKLHILEKSTSLRESFDTNIWRILWDQNQNIDLGEVSRKIIASINKIKSISEDDKKILIAIHNFNNEFHHTSSSEEKELFSEQNFKSINKKIEEANKIFEGANKNVT